MKNLFLSHLPLIIAHRDGSCDTLENTLAAINLAWQRGADGVEIDDRLNVLLGNTL